MTEEQALVVLNAIPGLGSVRIRRLVECFKTARNVLEAREKDILGSGIISPNGVKKIFDFDRDNFLQSEYNLIREHQARIVSIFDVNYPDALRNIHDPPIVLYVKGKLPQDDGLAVGVVGSRNASVYGLTVAEKLSGQLSELGITVVSGLARGVDAAAHRGCLRTGGQTIGVIGCGLCHIFPEENKALYQEIAQKGAVISEFAMATPAMSCNFPARNRIISGLSLAVLVVEAALKSGALITSHFALEQGRDVFAVPGKIDSPNSQGVNQLIKQGAKLVMGFEDILQELEPQIRRRENRGIRPGVDVLDAFMEHDLSENEIFVIKFLNQQPLYIDDLVLKSGQTRSDIAGILLNLELRKIVKQLPGKYFVRA